MDESVPAPQSRESGPSLDATADLVVVSNRQPYRHDYDDDGDVEVDRPVGGLSEALDEVLRRDGGTWVAWGDGSADRDVVQDDRVAVPPDDPAYTLRRVWLTDRQVEDYYYGFSNQVLWPLCHGCVTKVHHERGFWDRYRAANRRFAEAAVEAAGEGDVVWFQDYHLGLAPRLVRSTSPGSRLVHFWHIPWPDPGTFELCPHREDLLDGLLANDLLGFHRPAYGENFLACVETLEGATVDWNARRAHYRGRTTRVGAFPLGVPVERIRRNAAGQGHERPHQRIAGRRQRGAAGRSGPGERDARQPDDVWSLLPGEPALADVSVAIGVDRLDYTKGIVQRLEGLERLWERKPQWRGELTYVQIASESRSRIPAYREVQRAVSETVSRINERFGTDEWQPVVFTTATLPKPALCRCYRHSDVALVTPLKDGMNLVAQEYVAANLDGQGVLVLGRGAGVHDLLGDGAVSVTPFDVDGIADAIHAALTMAPDERRERMRTMARAVLEHDIDGWPDRILQSVSAPDAPRIRS